MAGILIAAIKQGHCAGSKRRRGVLVAPYFVMAQSAAISPQIEHSSAAAA
jgi:hypothetical protein